jgi:hypothetical protein
MTTRRTPFPARLQISLCLLATLAFISGCSGSGGSSGPQRAPAPVVANVSPSSVPVGSSAFTLAVSGSNFQPQAVVTWNTSALATTYNSTTSLSAAVPANLTATGVVANITVTNPDGQASTGGTTSQQVSITNPAPTLTTVAPQSLYAGSGDTTFTLTGANFNSSSVAMAGSAALTTTFVSSTQLTAVVPAATLATVGTLSLTVSNPAPGGGTSQAVSVTLNQPAATLTSLSPSSATVGSSPVPVTITGSYFTPTAVVYLNYLAQQTTYVSSTSIQFTVPSQYLANTGDLTVLVRDPASQYSNSNSLTFSVVNPVPVLTIISPTSVTAGAPNFTLTLTGTNFVQSATIQINGATIQPNLYPTATSATVVVPASAVSTVGTVNVTITNPAPGGGTSAAQTLNIISANNRIRTVNLAAADLGWDSAHSLLIASTLSSSTNNPNSIVTIDPLQGTVVTAQALPSQPAGISVTSDGSYVYVTLPCTGQVERLTLPSLTPDITFSLGNDSNGHYYLSNHVAAAPGQPHTVAITRHSSTTTAYGSNGGVVIYDDGVPRSNIAMPSVYYGFYDDITWGADATTLYATNFAISPSGDDDIFKVDASGVTLLSDTLNVLDASQHLAFDATTGHLIDGDGLVVNPVTGQEIGRFAATLPAVSPSDMPFALDLTQRKAFFLTPSSQTNSTGLSVEAFDLDRINYINSILLYGPGLGSASAMVRWGSSGLAIASTQIYILDGSFVAPTGISSAVGGYIAPAPTLTSVTPAAVAAGSPDTQVTLTGRDFTQASEVTWNNQTLVINSVSDTQLVVTIPASLLTDPVASAITVTNGPGTGSSSPLAFTVLPNLGASTQLSVLNISGRDLVWDNTHSLIYVAVPSNDPVYANSIAIVDPSKTALQQTIPVPQGPSSIAISDDGQYLYSGFFNHAIIQRYDLPSFTLDLTIPSGGHAPPNDVGLTGTCTFAVSIQVAPGSPQTIAVGEGNPEEFLACGGFDIYDNATPRPGYFTSQAFITAFAWGPDATTLYGQSEILEPQTLDGFSVSPSGVTLSGQLNTGGLGLRVHFDAGTGLLYSDSGIITNPVGPAQVGNLAGGAGDLLVTDDTLKRIFVLTNTNGNSGSGQGAVSYTLDIFDLNTYALLNSITIPDVLGTPFQMARWGTNGIVFVTTGTDYTTPSPGALYILQGNSISGTP